MRVIYSPRAIRDLQAIADYYRTRAGAQVASAIAERIEAVIDRLGDQPESAPRVRGRVRVRMALTLRYPYKVFYRLNPDSVEILHIRHAARRPWGEERPRTERG